MMNETMKFLQKTENLNRNTNEVPMDTSNKEHKQWEPYVNNQGTVLAFKGKDGIYIAGDKRISVGFSIQDRNTTKIHQLSDSIVLASSGMHADVLALVKNLKIRIDMYKSANKKDPDVENIAQLLSVTLYGRRFFPYYAFNILCGLDSKGGFKMFGYDAIGSFEEKPYLAAGSGRDLIVPLLDRALENGDKPLMNNDECMNLAKQSMNGCANRDIYTGDKLEICVIKGKGDMTKEEFELRKD